MHSEQEALLRAHIRHLLLKYALKHLTIDYVAFSEDAVEGLFKTLRLVSLNDPHTIALPIDPLALLFKSWDVYNIQPYNELWIKDSEAMESVKHAVCFRGKSPTERCWDEKADEDLEVWSMCRPLSPILTAESIRKTPRPGDHPLQDVVASTHTELLKAHNIDLTEVRDLSDPVIKIAEALDTKLPMDAGTHSAMVDMWRSVTNNSSSELAQADKCLKDFLRSDSPSLEFFALESPPLFPKDRRPGHTPGVPLTSEMSRITSHTSQLQSISDIAPLLSRVEFQKDEDDDLYKEHMIVVNGWQTYNIPSSPISEGTPSLGDGTSDVDELELPSSPDGNLPLINSIIRVPVDDYEIPRSEKPGNSRHQYKPLGDGQRLGDFLTPLLHRPQHSTAHIVTSPRSQSSSSHTSITKSGLLQLPVAADDEPHAPSESFDTELDLNAVMACVFGKHVEEDPLDIILKEHFDPKDSQLMDVPRMPPPNEHPSSSMYLPKALTDLIFVSQPIGSDARNPSSHGLLKKVKGLQPLNLELSWRPFSFGTSIPTDEEVTGVESDLRVSLVEDIEINGHELDILLRETSDDAGPCALESSGETFNAPSDRLWADHDTIEFKHKIVDFEDSHELILTAEELRRLHGLSRSVEPHRELDGDIQEVHPGSPAHHKFMNLTETEHGPAVDAHRGYNDPDIEAYVSKRRKLTRRMPGIEAECDDVDLQPHDSGICMDPWSPDEHLDHSRFQQLAFDSEGFEGQDVVGDVLPDVDRLDFSWTASGQPYRCSPDYSPAPVNYSDARLDSDSAPVYNTHLVTTPPAPEDTMHVGGLPPSAFHSAATLTETGEYTYDAPIPPTNLGLSAESASLAPLLVSKSPKPLSKSTIDPSLASSEKSNGRKLRNFLAMRGRTSKFVEELPDASMQSPAQADPVTVPQPMQLPVKTPEELLDARTIRLTNNPLPNHVHRYMASIDLMQKRGLVNALRSPKCSVALVERESLGNAHLILDPNTAVLFVSLLTLPVQSETVIQKLSELSWHFLHVLVIFEAYPESRAYKRDQSHAAAPSYAYSDVVIKAVKKLRRSMGIAEALDSKSAACIVYFAFANTVDDAAMLTRIFGDLAESQDETGGVSWVERSWLDLDEQEGECDLGGMAGMNVFVASIILSQTSLEDLLDKPAPIRLEEYAPLVGWDRMNLFNEEIARRLASMQLPPSSPEDQSAPEDC